MCAGDGTVFDGQEKLRLDCSLGEESLSTEMKQEAQLTTLGLPPAASFDDSASAGEAPGPLVMDPSDIKVDPSGDTPPANTGAVGVGLVVRVQKVKKLCFFCCCFYYCPEQTFLHIFLSLEIKI